MTDTPSCRFCGSPLEHVFADLGVTPLANSFIAREDLWRTQPFLPLCARVCANCLLVQLEPHEGAPEDIFSDYAYFSSYSSTWLEHSRRYTEEMIERLRLDERHSVVELASNDGYLLKYFVDAGVRVLGVEPAANVAAVAERNGVPTEVAFFGRETAARLRHDYAPELMVANNVLAHVPDVNDFVAGIADLLAPSGIVTIEVPHLLRLIDEVQFDTIYHEHFSYFSLLAMERVLGAHGLTVFDVEEIPTHGGSLRVFARHAEDDTRLVEEAVPALLDRERAAGLDRIDTYLAFSEKVKRVKRDVLRFFVEAQEEGRTIVGYGAPAKGNTLLNYCGIGRDFIEYTVDRNPHKQGRYLPGTRIPILAPEEIERTRPDYVFILPWNLKDEVMEQMAGIREWGGRFVVHSPELRVHA